MQLLLLPLQLLSHLLNMDCSFGVNQRILILHELLYVLGATEVCIHGVEANGHVTFVIAEGVVVLKSLKFS